MIPAHGKAFALKDKQQNHPETQLKNGTNTGSLPPLISIVASDSKHYIDNLFAGTRKKLKLNSLVIEAEFTQRSGIEVTEAVPVLLLWKWLNTSSIAMFAKKALGSFSKTRKDVMYDGKRSTDSLPASSFVLGSSVSWRHSLLSYY
ncbi:MAG: hypothetical protein L3J26_07305 [Candidatus Polarisedimenticolaceae bacterium]|nr:hypothetical protein [Candidatus Polarisedimenticolaceae bacterium]